MQLSTSAATPWDLGSVPAQKEWGRWAGFSTQLRQHGCFWAWLPDTTESLCGKVLENCWILGYHCPCQRCVHLGAHGPTVVQESIVKVPNQELTKKASSILREPLMVVYTGNSSILYVALRTSIAFSHLQSLARYL